jgi:DNA-binding IclR family transcriptional regulator
MSILNSAADVLRCFSEQQTELTLTEIVALRGTPKSSTSRLLNLMREAGFLEISKVGRKYRVATLMLHLSQLYRDKTTLLARAEAVIHDLVEETGHTGYISALDRRDVVGLTGYEGRHVLRVAAVVGRRLPASASATGRALLSRMPEAQVCALYQDGVIQPTDKAPAHLDEILSRIRLVRNNGFSEAYDETNHGVGAIATAVADPAKDLVLSLCIAFPAATISQQEREQITRRIKEETAKLAHEFGDDGQTAISARQSKRMK